MNTRIRFLTFIQHILHNMGELCVKFEPYTHVFIFPFRYDTVQVTIYYVLSIILGSVLSILWGIVFGIVNFFTVWFAQPFIKLFFNLFRCMYIVHRTWIRMFCDPFNESIALALSRIGGKFTMNIQGIQNV